MRGKRYKRNKGTEVPQFHIALDTETEDTEEGQPAHQTHRLKLGCAVFWERKAGQIKCRQRFQWRNNADFWAWFATKLRTKHTTWIWAHNQGFDANVCEVFGEMDNENLTPKFLALGDDICLITGRYQGKKIAFVDTKHWFDGSVQTIGADLGFPKLAESPSGLTPEQLTEYCWRDCEIVERAANHVCDMILRYDLGCARYTAAGQAVQHWRHMPEFGDVYKPSRPAESEVARESLYGGRFDALFRGVIDAPVYELDVNGAYGHAMGTALAPVKHIVTAAMDHPPEVLDRYGPLRCAAQVDLDTEVPYPVWLPDWGLLWAVGTFTTVLPGPELLRAHQAGAVRRVRALSVYELGEPCASFADYWWRRRQEAKAKKDKLMERFAKLMPCRLYGKLCQLEPKWVPVGPPGDGRRWGSLEYFDPEANRWHPGRVVAGVWEYDQAHALQRHPDGRPMSDLSGTRWLPRKDWRDAFPAISAWTTSHIRLLMDDFKSCAGPEDVYYQAVDALYVSQQGFDRLKAAGHIDPEARGKLKVKPADGLPYASVHFHGVNVLRVNGHLKAAGLPRKHREYHPGKCTYQVFERLDAILNRGPDGSVWITPGHWQLGNQVGGYWSTPAGWQQPPRLADGQLVGGGSGGGG